jgi:hypothetical protein
VRLEQPPAWAKELADVRKPDARVLEQRASQVDQQGLLGLKRRRRAEFGNPCCDLAVA